MKRLYLTLVVLLTAVVCCGAKCQPSSGSDSSIDFRVLVLTERGGQHESFAAASFDWLEGFSKEHNFEYTEIRNTEEITEEFLSQYAVIIQLDYPPYTWTEEAEEAFIKYIEEGRGGWVGFHHATLLGEFDGYPLWQWFSDFMGGIRFKNYIAPLATATVYVEDQEHPVMEGVHDNFLVPNDEWYTFDKNPRNNKNIHVLANVDESSYQPLSDVKMGDHPAIWVNRAMKARNVYFLMGHEDSLYASVDFKKMFGNAILWAAGK